MKIKNNRKINLTAGAIALAFTIGLFIGVFLVDYGYIQQLNPVQEELKLAQETILQYQELCEILEAQLQCKP